MVLKNRPDRGASLHFFCGKMAAGKSTLAKELAAKYNAILLVEDDWLTPLFAEEIVDIPSYIKYSERLKGPLAKHVVAILSQDLPVVLDFPANTIKQRDWFRRICEQAVVPHTLHFVDASNDLCKQQLKARSKDKPGGSAFTSEAEFDAITKYFQAPEESEGFNIIRYGR
jgi:predicted kinase